MFEDLGFSPQESSLLLVKSKLLTALCTFVDTFDKQADAAAALGVAQSRISEITNGKLSKFSTDLLIKLCEKAGIRVNVDTELEAA
ncbi:MAG TPA: XRE family transcriptional regulator [Rhodothermales bacterium]|nr:XRE family transcriptional regulator [Rhodothermales bacterium]